MTCLGLPFLSSYSTMARKTKYVIPLQLIELENENYHILIETEFLNGESGKWAIDTGASKSVFDTNQLNHFRFTENSNTDIQSSGIGEVQIETQTGIIFKLKIGDFELNHWPVAIIDLQFVNKLYSQFTEETIVGLLGSDFLVAYSAVIDYRKLELTFYA